MRAHTHARTTAFLLEPLLAVIVVAQSVRGESLEHPVMPIAHRQWSHLDAFARVWSCTS